MMARPGTGDGPSRGGAVVVLTFDYDAESAYVPAGVAHAERDLSLASLGAFAVRRGLSRVVELLDRLDLKATFFVPGETVEAHPEDVRDLAERGHEIGHHGHQHSVIPTELSAQAQRDDFERGVEAIHACTGMKPLGHRAPGWVLTPVTLALLDEHGLRYDSSCMGDDRPYLERFGDHEILELPVHWTLDDVPHLAWLPDRPGPLRDPAEVVKTFRREVDCAIAEARPIVLTCHPEVIGRAGAMKVFGEFVAQLRADLQVEFKTCIELAEDVMSG